MSGWWQDIRQGVRLLWRAPGFSAIGIVSLAVGLGGGAALFSVLNAFVYRPMSGHDTSEIQTIHTSNREGGRYSSTSFADFQSFVQTPGLFASACATRNIRTNLAAGEATHVVAGSIVSGDCFNTFRVQPEAGRLLNRSDDAATGTPPRVVISHALWVRSFNQDQNAVGRGVMVGTIPAVIIGVAEPGFAGLSLDAGSDVWVPVSMAPVLLSPQALTNRGERQFHVFARLADGVTSAMAAERLQVVAENLRREDPAVWTDDRHATRVVTITREIDARFIGGGSIAEIAALTFAAISGLVMIACLNLAMMMLARGAGRTRELSIRLALGASRWRLLRQLATESLVVSLGGAIAGVALVALGVKVFDAYRPTEIPAVNLAIDWRVAGFAAALACIAPVLFGVMPGAHALRLAIVQGLRGRIPLARRRLLGIRVGLRELLLGAQVTVAFALLVMAALIARSLLDSTVVSRPPQAEHVVIVPVDLNTNDPSDAATLAVTVRIAEAINRTPGVEQSSIAAIVPLTGSFLGIEGRADNQPADSVNAFDGNLVAPGYFSLLGIPQRSGRDFTASDRADAARVAIVSESLARRLWQTTSVVGRVMILRTGLVEVVGVVADVPYRSVDGAPQPVLYLPIAQSAHFRLVVHARSARPAEIGAALSRTIRAVDARVLVGAPVSFDQYIDQSRIEGRVAQWTGLGAGLLQLGLVLMATWGLVAYAVERRTPEIAIRRALGATENGILQLVMRPTLWVLAVSAVAGSSLGALAAAAMRASMIGIAPIDLRFIAPAALLAVAVVIVAAWLPARRAASIEPASALKQI